MWRAAAGIVALPPGWAHPPGLQQSMNILDRLRGTLAKMRAERAETACSAYWRTATSAAMNKEPRDKPEAIASAMEAIGKTDQDLEQDAALLADLAAAEAQLTRESEVHRTVLQLRSRAIDLDKEVEKLRADTKAKADEAEAARRQASSTEHAMQTAREHAAQLRRKLATRGHQQAAAWVADHDAEQRRHYEIEALESALRTAQSELAQANVDLAEAQRRAGRELGPHAFAEERERHQRDQEQMQLREKIVDRRQQRVTEIEAALLRLRSNEAPAK